jgi:hypothetical protein
MSTVDLALKGLILYKSQEVILSAVFLLFRRIIKLVSVYADNVFPVICDHILEIYTPGKEEGINVIIIGISLLFNETNTKA